MPSDAELTDAQRAAAIERIGEDLALRSGAGCGKTFVLARRFVELLRNCGDAEDAVGRFVALTFTEKAALEMSSRVRRMLSDAAAGAAGDERRRLRCWLEELPEVAGVAALVKTRPGTKITGFYDGSADRRLLVWPEAVAVSLGESAEVDTQLDQFFTALEQPATAPAALALAEQAGLQATALGDESWVFVCCHAARDSRCGGWGPAAS